MRLLSCHLFYICITVEKITQKGSLQTTSIQQQSLDSLYHHWSSDDAKTWKCPKLVQYLFAQSLAWFGPSLTLRVWTFAQRCHVHFSQSESQWKMLQMFPWVKMRNKSPYRTCILLYVLIGEKWRYYVLQPDC